MEGQWTIGVIALAALAVVGTAITVRPPIVVLINFDDSGASITGTNNYKIHFTQATLDSYIIR